MTYIRGNVNNTERITVSFVAEDGTDCFEASATLLRFGTKNYRTESGVWIEVPVAVRLDMLRLVQEKREEILAGYPVKTLAGWSESGISEFREYCVPGNPADDAMVAYFGGSVPPAVMRAGFLQAGEPVGSAFDGEGRLRTTYTTFQKEGGAWIYKGTCFLEESESRGDTPLTVIAEIRNLEKENKEYESL